MRLQSFPSGGAAGCIAVVLLPWKGWEAGGAGGFRVVGLQFAVIVGTPVSKGGTVEGEGGAVGLFCVVGRMPVAEGGLCSIIIVVFSGQWSGSLTGVAGRLGWVWTEIRALRCTAEDC